jgi:hypothetical protein
MKTLRPIAILAMLGLLIGPNSGCLCLSMLNRETPDVKQRLDALDRRVSALEAARVSMQGPPIIVPGPPMQSQSPQAIPLGQNPAGYP